MNANNGHSIVTRRWKPSSGRALLSSDVLWNVSIQSQLATLNVVSKRANLSETACGYCLNVQLNVHCTRTSPARVAVTNIPGSGRGVSSLVRINLQLRKVFQNGDEIGSVNTMWRSVPVVCFPDDVLRHLGGQTEIKEVIGNDRNAPPQCPCNEERGLVSNNFWQEMLLMSG